MQTHMHKHKTPWMFVIFWQIYTLTNYMTFARSIDKKQYSKCLDKLEKAKYIGEIFHTLKNDEFEVVKCCMTSTCKMI